MLIKVASTLIHLRRAVPPCVFAGGYLLLLALPQTRQIAVRWAQENQPVELLTFVLLLIGGAMGVRLSAAAKNARIGTLPVAFYAFFGVMLLLIAMEEISWGQWFFNFQTPESIRVHNTQGELTLHNLRGIGGNTEYLRLAFGVGGLIGIAARLLPALRSIAAPTELWAWFAVITAIAGADLFCEIAIPDSSAAKAMDVMSEIVELLIAISAMLYLALARRDLVSDNTLPAPLLSAP